MAVTLIIEVYLAGINETMVMEIIVCDILMIIFVTTIVSAADTLATMLWLWFNGCRLVYSL